MHQPIRCRFVLVFAVLWLLSGCDEIPSRPSVPDRLKVALVTATTADASASGGTWTVYEIDEEGTVGVVKQSGQRLDDVTYTSFLGTDGAFAFRDATGTLLIRDLASGSEFVLGSYGPVRFSFDGTRMVYGRMVGEGEAATEQVFQLNRVTGVETQLTNNDCQNAGEPPVGCVLGGTMPLIGAENAVYLLLRRLDESGTARDAILEVTRQGVRRELLAASPSEMALQPRSFHQNTLLVDFARIQQGTRTGNGFIAIAVSTRAAVENDVDLTMVSFCYDGSVIGLSGDFVRILDITGQALGSIPLPSEYGTAVGLQCSLTPKTRD